MKKKNLITVYNNEENLQNEVITGGLKKLKLIRSTPKVNNNNNNYKYNYNNNNNNNNNYNYNYNNNNNNNII